jgi:hypothetical protein
MRPRNGWKTLDGERILPQSWVSGDLAGAKGPTSG